MLAGEIYEDCDAVIADIARSKPFARSITERRKRNGGIAVTRVIPVNPGAAGNPARGIKEIQAIKGIGRKKSARKIFYFFRKNFKTECKTA